MIDPTTITDPMYLKQETAQQTAYTALGQSKYLSLCNQYGISDALIPPVIPYTPARLQVVCILITIAQDLVGSEWRQVREGLTIDVYQAKLNTLNEEYSQLLGVFTPSMCGYVDESSQGTSVSLQWGRA